MRHVIANLATYLIAGLLLAGSVAFAWARSAQLEIASERRIWSPYHTDLEEAFPWLQAGADSYVSNCANCHGRQGEGWDQYPGLGHTAALLLGPGGRDYLIDLHLYGLASPRWRVPMPPMGHMQDPELAAVINHVLMSFGNEQRLGKPINFVRPNEIKSRRGRGLSPAQVNIHRPANLEKR